MRYDNEMKITMRTTKMAEKAMEILKNRLIVGFDCDKDYDENPAMRFAEDLEIDGRIVKLPFDHAYYLPKDALTVMCELMEYLAKNFTKSSFSFENCNLADEDMSRVDATFKKGVLEIQTTYYPNGYCEEYFCPECGAVAVYAEDYEEDNIYICPECGEEIDLSEQIPEVTKKRIVIL